MNSGLKTKKIVKEDRELPGLKPFDAQVNFSAERKRAKRKGESLGFYVKGTYLLLCE